MVKRRLEFTNQELEEMLSDKKSDLLVSTQNTIVEHFKSVKTDEVVEAVEAVKVVKSNKLCFHADCKKKLMLTDPVCKCKEKFCSLHRMPEVHNCTFDFKAAGRQYLSTMLVKVAGDKVDKI